MLVVGAVGGATGAHLTFGNDATLLITANSTSAVKPINHQLPAWTGSA